MQPDPFNVRDHLLEAGISADEVERMLRARLPGTLIDDHAPALIGARDNLRVDYASSQTYGSFMGGDPRDFEPDPECSTEAERAAHRRACEAAERGEPGSQDLAVEHIRELPDGSRAFAQDQRFGLGTTRYVDVDFECLIHNVERMCELLDASFTATALPPISGDLPPSSQPQHDVEGATASGQCGVGATGS